MENNGVQGTGTFCEGVSPGRCSPAQQRGPGRYQTTANRRIRKKWSQEENRTVMECFYLSSPNRRGYRKRMHDLWKNKGTLDITEQRLIDQKAQIIKKKWLSDVELEEIKRNIEDAIHGEINSESFEVDRVEIDVERNDSVDAGFPQMERNEGNSTPLDRSFDMNDRFPKPRPNENLSEEEVIMIDEIRMCLEKNRERLPSLRGMAKSKIAAEVNKINVLFSKLSVSNISEVNDLFYAGSVLVTNKLATRKKGKEPWWKRRLEGQLKEFNKHLGYVNTLINKGKLREKVMRQLQIKCKINQKSLKVVREELKQRIKALSAKIKRYSDRINQFQQNRTFKNNQGKFYRDLESQGNKENLPPDPQESQAFWSDIWEKTENHNHNAEWLNEIKNDLIDKEKQNEIVISQDKLKKSIKKIPNWKSPGPDMVQGFWIKNFSSLHQSLQRGLQECLESNTVPLWMTKGRTVLLQKDTAKGTVPSNYRPITCLPLAWKLLTSNISDEIYEFLENNMLLPQEQKGCRRNSKGTHDLLFIDKMILKEVKRRKRNLFVGWIDYKKAYDMIPHSWISECLELFGINDQIRRLIEESMKSWRVELTCGEQNLGEVAIKRGIFQGDSLSPLLFVICLIPLTLLLRKMDQGYHFETNKQKINHLLFMDDLKLYASSEKALESLVQTVRIFSSDIGMQFGIEKCAALRIHRGNLKDMNGIKLPGDREIKGLKEGDEYKYLGVLEADNVKCREMKEKISNEYKRRVRKILESKLNGGNVIQGINTYAVSLLRYSAAFIDWTKDEVRQLDKRTRKLMTMHKALHPKSDVDRLYLPRKNGGRGLLNIEDTVEQAKVSLDNYVESSLEEFLVAARNVSDRGEVEDVKIFKERKKGERSRKWREKPLYGQFIRQTDEFSKEERWLWLKEGSLKRETESLILAAQEQAIRTNSIKAKIDKTQVDSKCRMCGQSDETINHILCECSKMAQREYKRRHDWLGKRIHWEICKKNGIEVKAKWYDHKPEAVCENERCKILWDFNIQTDHVIEARRPDMIVVNKIQNKCTIVDFAVPYDTRVTAKEQEKVLKYQDLARELKVLWDTPVKVVPIIIGALGTPPKDLKKWLKILEIETTISELQKTTILQSARILRKVLEV